MSNYDELDDFVDDLFRKNENDDGEYITPKPGDIIVSQGRSLLNDWRVERIDEIIQDAYDEAIWWHNNRISEGSDPRSGLRSLPYVPPDEKYDGPEAMARPSTYIGSDGKTHMLGKGGGGGSSETSYDRNGDPRRFLQSHAEVREQLINTLWERGIVSVYTWDRRWVKTQNLTTNQLADLLQHSKPGWHLTCVELAVVVAVGLALLIFMMVYS